MVTEITTKNKLGGINHLNCNHERVSRAIVSNIFLKEEVFNWSRINFKAILGITGFGTLILLMCCFTYYINCKNFHIKSKKKRILNVEIPKQPDWVAEVPQSKSRITTGWKRERIGSGLVRVNCKTIKVT